MIYAKITLDEREEVRRSEPRIEADASIAVRPFGEQPMEGRLINLSSGGFMAEIPGFVDPGARIWLTLPGYGRVAGKVVWAKDGRIGGVLAQSVDPLAVLQATGLSPA